MRFAQSLLFHAPRHSMAGFLQIVQCRSPLALRNLFYSSSGSFGHFIRVNLPAQVFGEMHPLTWHIVRFRFFKGRGVVSSTFVPYPLLIRLMNTYRVYRLVSAAHFDKLIRSLVLLQKRSQSELLHNFGRNKPPGEIMLLDGTGPRHAELWSC